MGNKYIIIFSFSELVNGNSAASARMMNYARALSPNVNVILLSFTRSEQISQNNLQEIEKGIFTTGVAAKNTKPIYFLQMFKFVFAIDKLINQIGKQKVTSLFLYPQYKILLDILSIIYLKKIKENKLFCEINEVRQFSSILLADKSKGVVVNLKRKWVTSKYILSEKITKYYTGLVCISTNIKEYFEKYNKNSIRVPILANHTSLKIKTQRLKKDENFRIGFFGSVNYHKENLELLIQSLNKLKKDYSISNFNLDFFGPADSFTSHKIAELAVELDLENNIYYKGDLDQNHVLTKMQSYHLLILPRGNNLQNKYGFSTKLSEYLSTGIPVLITDVSDNGMYVKDNINGFIVPPDDIEALALKLNFIYHNYNDYAETIETNSIKLVNEHFIFSNYSKPLTEFLC